jgi:hypothetical protein
VVNIKGAPDLYVKFGSPVTLHCNMSNYLQEPSYVSWHLNGSLISQLKNQPPHPLRGKTLVYKLVHQMSLQLNTPPDFSIKFDPKRF